jgi:AraC-like DNA-binding protein
MPDNGMKIGSRVWETGLSRKYLAVFILSKNIPIAIQKERNTIKKHWLAYFHTCLFIVSTKGKKSSPLWLFFTGTETPRGNTEQNKLKKFIRMIRLAKAQQMLQQGNESIAAIALASGFTDPGYFARVFKQEFGCTPQEWKGKG